MKIVLIVPCEADNEWKNKRSVFVFPPLSFAFLKSMTPAQHEVIIIDETFEPITIPPDVDLIGISIITATATSSLGSAPIRARVGLISPRDAQRICRFGSALPTVSQPMHITATVHSQLQLPWKPTC